MTALFVHFLFAFADGFIIFMDSGFFNVVYVFLWLQLIFYMFLCFFSPEIEVFARMRCLHFVTFTTWITFIHSDSDYEGHSMKLTYICRFPSLRFSLKIICDKCKKSMQNYKKDAIPQNILSRTTFSHVIGNILIVCFIIIAIYHRNVCHYPHV